MLTAPSGPGATITTAQLGLGTTSADKNSPTQVDPGSTWKAVSAGSDYTLAIKADGTLWAWGENNDGQLGLGTADTNAHPTPTQVAPGTTWKAVSAGQYDTLAIRSDGTLWAWGSNGDGELGLGSTTQTDAPAQVGGLNTWTAVSSGYGYTLALRSDGSLWGCGDNSRGELGLGIPPHRDVHLHAGRRRHDLDGGRRVQLRLVHGGHQVRRHALGLRPQRCLPARPRLGQHQ